MNLYWNILDNANPYSPASKKLHVMPYRETSHHLFYKDSVE